MNFKNLMHRVVTTATPRRALIALTVAGVTSLLLAIAMIWYLRADLPSIEDLSDYAPSRVTKVYSDDGHLIGEFFKERRTVVAIDELPAHVRLAFVAAEDSRFYEHEGLDYMGILRAALKNLRPGAHLQGASTITQQTVKTMVVGPERSYTRKMREALLTRDLEQMLDKDDILHLYVNQIYFGNGAYGVEEAAQTYFGKSVRDVSLGEAAYLAAIPKHPSRYTITADPAAAKHRQTYVLERMLSNGWATKKQVEAAIAEAVPRPADRPAYLRRAPHYVEEVRRRLIKSQGEHAVYHGGLTVYAGVNAVAQVAAQDALRSGLESLGRKHGWPGAGLRIEVDHFKHARKILHEAYDKRLAKLAMYAGHTKKRAQKKLCWDLRDISSRDIKSDSRLRRSIEIVSCEEETRTTGLVSSVDTAAKIAWIDLGGAYAQITNKSLAWARRFSPTARTRAPTNPSQVLNRGDLVAITLGAPIDVQHGGKRVVAAELIPRPVAESAFVAIHPHTRHVRALVGGYEQRAGDLIRATQSMRQAGSTFKPFVYAAGIMQKAITPASICPDSPVLIRDPWTGEAWKPQNYEDGKFDGNITYRTALTKSKNTCSVKLTDKIGYEAVIETARAAGIKSPLPENLTLALGTGDVTPFELANGYATLAAGGLYAEPIFIRKVVAANGDIIEERTAALERTMPEAVTYVVTSMMRSVVEEGTARRARALERPLAGKTGTTNKSRNVWFSGFSPELVATVWVGFDDNTPLGRATGGGTALPIWINFMAVALADTPPNEFPEPEEGIVRFMVDKRTGQASESEGALEEVFLEGTEPEAGRGPLESPFLIDEEEMAGPIDFP